MHVAWANGEVSLASRRRVTCHEATSPSPQKKKEEPFGLNLCHCGLDSRHARQDIGVLIAVSSTIRTPSVSFFPPIIQGTCNGHV
jgi:hypothetical protein